MIAPYALLPSRALPAAGQASEKAWFPPLDPTELRRVLQKMRVWEPFDADALLDDVGTALDDVPPAEKHQREHAQRLRGHLAQLVDIAMSGEADVKDTAALSLIENARDLRSEVMSGDLRRAVVHLWRMAWTVNELLERLLATGQLTNVNAA
ncbi:DUF6415 family natural product biosynthesis protein [Streptomyces sp. NBC_01708]|uniref:DUF6415 family natural product biosynthesis protein n=1 Tax=Streptomyces sp. NBC_01708 TaxID=2975915 RepID=UPI002E368F20|nr:DUF6415 family natural product biosynthesis protein [Streptomyces sp. NBC_01708]